MAAWVTVGAGGPGFKPWVLPLSTALGGRQAGSPKPPPKPSSAAPTGVQGVRRDAASRRQCRAEAAESSGGTRLTWLQAHQACQAGGRQAVGRRQESGAVGRVEAAGGRQGQQGVPGRVEAGEGVSHGIMQGSNHAYKSNRS
ncbi:hypothetical protein HaLaN_19945 [Haematococcus lacustris]|uniref:Uncharacterized protein n=1 Tax=Haematococcus lacustris TaxID=44745 RepID=A0A6A0A0W6_HAELA|nr:hypothetical protein HaLaN_19945 [Haematococcus lacustris]